MIGDPTTLSHEKLLQMFLQRESIIADQERRLREQEQRLQTQEQAIADHQQIILQKEHRIAYLERVAFGSKRERFTVPDGQLVLPLIVDTERTGEAVESEEAKITVEYTRAARKQHPGRLPLPEHLDVVELVHEPEIDTSGMRCIGRETSDELVHVQERFFIRRHIRPKYVTAENDDGSQSVVIAPLPPRAIDKCIASDELLTELVVNKHVYHLPIHRQLERFASLGVQLRPSTVDGWQKQLGLRLRPLYAALRSLLEQTSYLQVDESGLAVQDRTKKGTTHRGFLWAYHAPIEGLVYFDYQRGRGRINCRDMLGIFRGYLQSDGYAAYREHKAREDVMALACWAHVRRKFFEAQTNDQARAEEMLAMIGRLYAVEREARERALSAADRKELRLEKSLPMTNAIGKWLVGALDETTPKSPIGAAVRYALSLWNELETYLYDGSLEIDNNLIENAIRPLALGRKNYLFAGSHDAAVNIAMYRSFFATCRRHQIDARRWLLYVLPRIATTAPADHHLLLPPYVDRSLLG